MCNTILSTENAKHKIPTTLISMIKVLENKLSRPYAFAIGIVTLTKKTLYLDCFSRLIK